MTERHIHDWTRTDGAWTCRECPETSAACGTCYRASGSSLLICPACLRHTERLLDDIADALSHYAIAPRSLARSPMAYSLVPPGQGDPLGIATPGDVEGALWGWVARWSELVGDPSNMGAANYLKGHHLWAAHNAESGWAEYLEQLRSLRHAARRIAGLLPQRLAEPCVYCGGDVVQDWADGKWQPNPDGLSDVVRCTGCDMTWNDRTHWRRATKQHLVELPAEHPDALVTMDQARMIFPVVPVRTMRSWAARSEPDYQRAVLKAQVWWQEGAWLDARHAHDERTADWNVWRDAGWTDAHVVDDAIPDVPPRSLPADDGRYRVGDLYALAVRWADDARRGPKVLDNVTDETGRVRAWA